MRIKIISLLITTLLSSYAIADVVPTSQGYDSKIQQVQYNPKNVIRISTKIGKATLIQLQNDESIMSKELSGLGMGDTDAWGLAIRGNNIFLKPKAENPDTNLLIVSDKNRTYSFDLITTKYNKNVSYVVKILYPQNKAVTNTQRQSVLPCSDGKMNFSYSKWGDNHLSPTYAWDDGRFTCFKFKTNTEQPVIYQIGSDGKETLVNSNMVNDILVVHGVANEFRLRLGKAVLGIKSFGLHPQGFNFKATTLKNEQRVVIDNE